MTNWDLASPNKNSPKCKYCFDKGYYTVADEGNILKKPCLRCPPHEPNPNYCKKHGWEEIVCDCEQQSKCKACECLAEGRKQADCLHPSECVHTCRPDSQEKKIKNPDPTKCCDCGDEIDEEGANGQCWVCRDVQPNEANSKKPKIASSEEMIEAKEISGTSLAALLSNRDIQVRNDERNRCCRIIIEEFKSEIKLLHLDLLQERLLKKILNS